MGATEVSSGPKIVYDEQAYDMLRALRNGLLTEALAEIAKRILERGPDSDGVFRVTTDDVQAAFAIAAERIAKAPRPGPAHSAGA